MIEERNEWFQVVEIEQDVFLIEEPGHVQSFLINGEHTSALVDTGMGFRNIRPAIEPLLREKTLVLNTHWHFDHIGGNQEFQDIGISQIESHLIGYDLPNSMLKGIYLKDCLLEGVPFPPGFSVDRYEIKGSIPTFFVSDGDRFDLGKRSLEAIETPGHTHGSLSFLDDLTNSLFCGDLLYNGALYVHFDDSALHAYISSLHKLLHRQRDFDRMFCSHNEYQVSTALLTNVLKRMEQIQKLRSPDQIVDIWGHKVEKYEFENFSILTKLPGSKGIKLLDFVGI